jgi:hypothetical protein
MQTWDEWDEYSARLGDWIDLRREPAGMGAYCTQIGPDGSGHERCGAACVASVLLSEGWDSDPYELMFQVAQDAGIENVGATSAQLLTAARKYGIPGNLWTGWSEAIEAIDRGEAVLCLLNNRYLIPRSYPSGDNWNAMHWIRVLGELDGGLMAYVYDPLTYCPQPTGTVYQGPAVYTTASIRAAIRKSPYQEAGITLRSPSGRRLNG